MISFENGTLSMKGDRRKLQVEYMQMIDAIKNHSNLFKDDKDFEMSTLFVLMDTEDQKDVIVTILGDMIESLEGQLKKGKSDK